MPVNPGPTRFSHQLRDQALHIVYGAVIGLIAPVWWLALAGAAFYGAVREGEQWKTLNTPSVWDSALDWTFVLIGSQVAFWLAVLIR